MSKETSEPSRNSITNAAIFGATALGLVVFAVLADRHREGSEDDSHCNRVGFEYLEPNLSRSEVASNQKSFKLPGGLVCLDTPTAQSAQPRRTPYDLSQMDDELFSGKK